jgi:hypothetical protein
LDDHSASQWLTRLCERIALDIQRIDDDPLVPITSVLFSRYRKRSAIVSVALYAVLLILLACLAMACSDWIRRTISGPTAGDLHATQQVHMYFPPSEVKPHYPPNQSPVPTAAHPTLGASENDRPQALSSGPLSVSFQRSRTGDQEAHGPRAYAVTISKPAYDARDNRFHLHNVFLTPDEVVFLAVILKNIQTADANAQPPGLDPLSKRSP